MKQAAKCNLGSEVFLKHWQRSQYWVSHNSLDFDKCSLVQCSDPCFHQWTLAVPRISLSISRGSHQATDRKHLTEAETAGIQLTAQRFHWACLFLSLWALRGSSQGIFEIFGALLCAWERASMDLTSLGRRPSSPPEPKQKNLLSSGSSLYKSVIYRLNIEIVYGRFFCFLLSLILFLRTRTDNVC